MNDYKSSLIRPGWINPTGSVRASIWQTGRRMSVWRHQQATKSSDKGWVPVVLVGLAALLFSMLCCVDLRYA